MATRERRASLPPDRTDQLCATEKRRRIKRGAHPPPAAHAFINELVCDDCGDCGVQSNCLALTPVDTPLGEKRRIDGFTLETFPLHHYSGGPRSRNYLDTLGYRLTAPGGPGIAYISDHEPVRRTRALEDGILKGSQLTVYDAHFPEIREHRYGHGSQEHASHMARSHPGTLVLAGHIGPMLSDDEVFATHRRHSKGLPNFRLALEGVRYRWNAAEGRFDRLASTERL